MEKQSAPIIQFDVVDYVVNDAKSPSTSFERNFDADLLLTPEGLILATSAEANRLFKMTEEELKTINLEGIILNKVQAGEILKEVERTGRANAQVAFRGKDGTVFECEILANLFSDCKGFKKVGITIRDNEERKKTELALKESEEKYRFLFENMLNGFAYCKIITNENMEPIDFEYLEINDSFERLTGLKRENVVGKKATDAIPGIKKSHPELFEIYGRVALTGKPEQFELYFEPLNIYLSISVYSPKNGFFAAVFENTTEQKQNERLLHEYSQGLELTVDARTQELVNTNERLAKAERFAAIGELAGMVGHDLRNPLTAIKNAIYYLDRKQSASMDAKAKEMFKVMNSSIEHANKIIGNLLEYSKEISLEIEETTPKSLLDYVLLMVQIPERIKIFDRTLDMPNIWVDINKIERVFINLITNAIDAMPLGGTIEIRSRQIDEYIEFSFIDTGSGMSEQTKSKIFMPLFTTKAQGMGFGLAICKRVVEAHDGRINVESTLGKGTTFRVILPIEHKIEIED